MKEKMFKYLEYLLESDVNIFSARPYLMDEFEINKDDATQVIKEFINQ